MEKLRRGPLATIRDTSYNFMTTVQFLEIISKMIKIDSDIIINTGIYKHYNNTCVMYCGCHDDSDFDEKLDIIHIHCKKNSFITIEQIVKALKKIIKQFLELEKQRCDIPEYYYCGMTYNGEKNKYVLLWSGTDDDITYDSDYNESDESDDI